LLKNLGEPVQPGESGGNVHVVCNVIINGQKWTIVSDGADGSAAYKWTKENFEELFPSGKIQSFSNFFGFKTAKIFTRILMTFFPK
jgi:hypothetical protein